MERYFILGNFNTWYDWRLILTSKNIPDPEPNTNYVKIDGMNGTLDLSESLTGEVTYQDRTITATFWTDKGTREDRQRLLREIRLALHGKKVKIIEPDDPEHYFYGRIKIKSEKNVLPYAEFTIEAVCEPWRYATYDSERSVVVRGGAVVDVVINNNGMKTLCPTITVSSGHVYITHEGVKTSLISGVYKLSNIKLRPGINIINVSGLGLVTFSYKEADI